MTEINREEWRMKRHSKRITLSEIAKEIGVTYNHLSQWENKPDYQVAADKVEAYMKYIESK